MSPLSQYLGRGTKGQQTTKELWQIRYSRSLHCSFHIPRCSLAGVPPPLCSFPTTASDSRSARQSTTALSLSPGRTTPSTPSSSVIWNSRFWESAMLRKFWMWWRIMWRMERCGYRAITIRWHLSGWTQSAIPSARSVHGSIGSLCQNSGHYLNKWLIIIYAAACELK